MLLRPEDAVDVYNYVREEANQFHGPTRSMVAGIMLDVDCQVAKGNRFYHVEAPDWRLNFRIREGRTEDKDGPVEIKNSRDKPSYPRGNSPHRGWVVLVKLEGDYDAFQRDWTLLRMFSHLWDSREKEPEQP